MPERPTRAYLYGIPYGSTGERLRKLEELDIDYRAPSRQTAAPV